MYSDALCAAKPHFQVVIPHCQINVSPAKRICRSQKGPTNDRPSVRRESVGQSVSWPVKQSQYFQ